MVLEGAKLSLPDVFRLAARQRAQELPFSFQGKPVGTLGQIEQRVLAGKAEAIANDLLARLLVLGNLAFNFSKLGELPEQDVGRLAIPDKIPSHDIGLEVAIVRNSDPFGLDEPFFRINFIHPAIPAERFGMTVLYERDIKSLSLYTCANIRLPEGRGLSRELICRALLAAADVLIEIGETPATVYAFNVLEGDDFEYDGGPLIASVQESRDRIFHVLESLGFSSASNRGFPNGARNKCSDNDGAQIGLDILRDNFATNWWQWAYVERFGEFSEVLDQAELTARLKQRQESDWRIIQGKIQYWFAGGGASEIIASPASSTETLLSILEDRNVSFDLANTALTRIIKMNPPTREVMIRVVNALKSSIFNPAAYGDDELRDTFSRHTQRFLRG